MKMYGPYRIGERMKEEDLQTEAQKKTQELVDKILDIRNEFLDEENELLDPVMRWIIYGRVINGLFGFHFRMAYERSIDILNRDEKKEEKERDELESTL